MKKNPISLVIAVLLAAIVLISISNCSSTSETTATDDITETFNKCQDIYAICNRLCEYIESNKYILANQQRYDSPIRPARVQKLEDNLNRWIKIYNHRSHRVPRELWHFETLPHQVKREDFNCK